MKLLRNYNNNISRKYNCTCGQSNRPSRNGPNEANPTSDLGNQIRRYFFFFLFSFLENNFTHVSIINLTLISSLLLGSANEIKQSKCIRTTTSLCFTSPPLFRTHNLILCFNPLFTILVFKPLLI